MSPNNSTAKESHVTAAERETAVSRLHLTGNWGNDNEEPIIYSVGEPDSSHSSKNHSQEDILTNEEETAVPRLHLTGNWGNDNEEPVLSSVSDCSIHSSKKHSQDLGNYEREEMEHEDILANEEEIVVSRLHIMGNWGNNDEEPIINNVGENDSTHSSKNHSQVLGNYEREEMELDIIANEEVQQTLSFLVSRFQEEVSDLRHKTDKEIKAVSNRLEKEIDELRKHDIHDLQYEMHKLGEANAALKIEVDHLKREIFCRAFPPSVAQPIVNSLRSAKQSPPWMSSLSLPSLFKRHITSNDEVADNTEEVNRKELPMTDSVLPQDTFTLMMISPLSQAWVLGISAFVFQMILIIMIGLDQIGESEFSSLFNVPFKVDSVVRIGQLLAIVFALVAQTDIHVSIRVLMMFWGDSHNRRGMPDTATKWTIHILLPNSLRLVQGILVMFITFVVIVQSENIIDLLKDFTALMILSQADNIFFSLAVNGFLGLNLQKETIKARAIKIQEEARTIKSNTNQVIPYEVSATVDDINQRPSTSTVNLGFYYRAITLIVIAVIMIGNWLVIVINQVNGTYFRKRYRNCTAPFDLAKRHFGNKMCYGGPLNTYECEFEGGDCVNFNLEFPLCKGVNRIHVQERVGDGNCDELFMSPDCNYDGGDCCPYNLLTGPAFGDGQCNGGILSTKYCGYDSGDCDLFHFTYSDCPLDNLSNMLGSDSVVLGNGVCDSGVYNSKECGYEHGDCNHGQVGQDIMISEQVRNGDRLAFSHRLSLDGSTMALGLYNTNNDGIFNNTAPGFVKVLRYNSTRKMWLQLGNSYMVGDSWSSRKFGDNFGFKIALSSSGNTIAILSLNKVRIYGFSTSLLNEWSQVGQAISAKVRNRVGIDIRADGTRLVIADENGIRIFDLESSGWVNVGNMTILDDDINDRNRVYNVQLNSLDGSRLLVYFHHKNDKSIGTTRAYYFNQNSTKSWTQMGQDIPGPTFASAISADGRRIATSSNSTSTVAPGYVNVFDYDTEKNEWIQVGGPINKATSSDGDGFGYNIAMSSNGDHLIIGSNSPDCLRFDNAFHFNKCTTGTVEFYHYDPKNDQFTQVIPNSFSPYSNRNIISLSELSDSSNFGLHFSMSGDGTLLSISGHGDDAFVKAYNLDDLFYTRCFVDKPEWIADGDCNVYPYDSEECGFDGGDCMRKPVEGFPNCFVHSPNKIGDGVCFKYPPYNSSDCGFDGGDCL